MSGPVCRQPTVGVRIGLALAALMSIALTVAPSAKAGPFPFPRPASLEPNISFWVNTFTYYSYRDFIIVDRDKIWRAYGVLHVPGYGPPSQSEVDWANSYLRTKYGDILERLATGHQPQYDDERHVADLFKGEPLSSYEAAVQNLRVQQGMRERFRESMIRARAYVPMMSGIFDAAGLPPDLALLPSVESGYEIGVRSKAGAVGMWQFTHATGKEYMVVGRWRDDRLNPVKATEAAAKLLRHNLDLLGDWPLAITAYNYGTGGMQRARDILGDDSSRILTHYDGPHFGFAAKNYYAEFLAALQVYRYRDKYFPGIDGGATPSDERLEEASAGQAPASTARKDFSAPGSSSTISKDTFNPVLSSTIAKDSFSPMLGASIRKDSFSPVLGASIRKDSFSPVLGASIRKDSFSPALGASIRKVSVLSGHRSARGRTRHAVLRGRRARSTHGYTRL